MEYENVFALGPMCGVSDPDAVLAASARCDELGLDTISAGGTIAWAMECAERGLIDAPWLRFGDGDALLRALDEIGAPRGPRRAAGRGLAPGRRGRSARARRRSPRTSRAWSCPATSRARCRRWRWAWRSTPAGADHNRSGAYEADLSGDLDRLARRRRRTSRAAIETEDRAAVMDSLILCKFLRGVFDDPFPEWARAAAARSPAGTSTARSCARPRAGSCWPSGCSTCARAGRRADDWLPDRLLHEPLELASGPGRRRSPRSACAP